VLGIPWRGPAAHFGGCDADTVSRDGGVDAETATSLLSRATGRHFRLVGRLSGGETGAHRLVGADGQAVVVKWDTTTDGQAFRREAVALSERLRCRAAWPVPAASMVEGDGILFVLQEFMAGAAPAAIDHRLVDQLLALHDRRLGLAEPYDPVRWPANLLTTLTVGGKGYCRHGSFRRYDTRTRSLIERIEAFGASLEADDFVGRDVIHWDLHPGNLLVDAHGLSAIVDTDFALIGDAAFDLVMLAVTSLALRCEEGVSARLFAEAFDQLDEVRTQTYLGHLFVRLIDWPIRRNSASEVDFWIAKAEELLTI
jgi:thiamine kinase-like enzyme